MNKTRTHAWCVAFGWQGGTIHQIAAITGVDVADLLYGQANKKSADYLEGVYAGKHSDLGHDGKNVNSKIGNLNFWLGVADGMNVKLGYTSS